MLQGIPRETGNPATSSGISKVFSVREESRFVISEYLDFLLGTESSGTPFRLNFAFGILSEI